MIIATGATRRDASRGAFPDERCGARSGEFSAPGCPFGAATGNTTPHHSRKQHGSKLDLTIRRDGKQQTVEATIAEMPEKVASAQRGAAQPGGSAARALGMELVALDPQLRQELHVPKEVSGVVVGQVASDSPAGQIPSVRKRRSGGLDRSAWRIGRLDRCRRIASSPNN
jgi:hypothetical protein